MEKSRIAWVDIAKFIGIFAIFLGHLGNPIGLFGNFVGAFHVPLFFFLSGCMFTLTNETDNFSTLFKKKFKSLIIPYFYLCSLFILIYGIYAFSSISTLFDFLREMLVCVRGVLHSGSLWFLPYLFIMTMEYGLLKKIFKNKYIILIVCILLCLFAENLPYNTILHPKYFWGIDTALYYIIYFAFGAVLFPWINKTLKNISNKKDKLFLIFSGISTSLYALLYFFEINLFEVIFYKLPLFDFLNPVVNSFILIWWFLLISKLFENSSFLQHLGKNSLYLCGNESLIKEIIPQMLSLVGLTLNVTNVLHSFIYVFILIVICVYVLIPIEKKLFNRLCQAFSLKIKEST